MESLTSIFLSTEFVCFVAGEIIQVIEAMPGSVVPLAMFLKLRAKRVISSVSETLIVFLNVRFAIFLRILFVFHSNMHFLICCKSDENSVY